MPSLSDVQGYANALVSATSRGDRALVKQLNDELEAMTPNFRGAVAITLASLVNTVLRKLVDITEEDEDEIRSQLLVATSGTAGTIDEVIESIKRPIDQDRDMGDC